MAMKQNMKAKYIYIYIYMYTPHSYSVLICMYLVRQNNMLDFL